jgi:hypothetical protein
MKLRWAVQAETPNAKPVLQTTDEHGKWIDVPTVEIPRKLGEPPACCGGGPQWGHAWTCPNCPC